MALRLASRQARLVVFGYNAVTSKIVWVRSPDGPQYAGMPLSMEGGQVMAYYKDGTTSDITSICGYDPAEGTRLDYSGELTITASYTDHSGNQFTADTSIEVADVDELVFVGLSNTVQKEGRTLDLSGVQIKAKYSDNTTRQIDETSVIFEPHEGEWIGHTETLSIQASWTNPSTGSDYSAQYELAVDAIEKLYYTHGPNKTDYVEGEQLDLSGVTVALKYKRSGDIETVTDMCSFNPSNGTVLPSYGTSIYATYKTAAGDEYTCETLVNVQASTIPINEIGPIIGEDLGLEFDPDMPDDYWDDFWSDFQPQEVPYYPVDGDYYIPVDVYDDILDYLNEKDAFAEYEQYGDIPYMVLPAGEYVSADGKNSIKATADIYIIAAMEKKDGKPEQLPAPSCVDYPYTNLYAYNQIQVLTFTLNSSDYVRCESGLKGGHNSATSGICRKMAGLGLPDVSDETMYTDYVTFSDDSIVNIPGILALPWCWYDDVPHNLSTLKEMVQNGEKKGGCDGIRHTGKVPYLTYSQGSLYNEVREQFPETYPTTVTYGDQEYVHVKA